jgi:hypothetical protein
MLNAVVLSVFMLSVVMLSVVAPRALHSHMILMSHHAKVSDTNMS